jgi:hypothetical protein
MTEIGDLLLKFTGEAKAMDVLAVYKGLTDIIGEIENATGWHVNVRGPKLPELLPYAIEAATPMRVWL